MKLIKAEKPYLIEQVQKLYQEAFPAIERKPFELILQKCREGQMELLAIEGEEGVFCGLAITVLYKDRVLLDYFAIAPEHRGGGIGSQILQLLKTRYEDKKFFLEIERSDVEAENKEQRIRRKSFYMRNGMVPMGYLVCVFGTEMEVLTDHCEVGYEEYHELYREVFGGKLGRSVKLLSR